MAKQKKQNPRTRAPQRRQTPSPAGGKARKPKSEGFFPFSGLNLQINILVAVCALLYANTLFHDYALDDEVVIQNNEHVKNGFSGVPELLTRDSFDGYEVETQDFLPGGRYRPLCMVMFAAEYQIFGDSPFIGHLVNVALYALTVVLLLLLFRRYLFRASPDAAFFAALIFAVHPVHTEVVANIKSRDEILSLLFMVLALYSLMAHFVNAKGRRYLLPLSAGYYLLSLLSKETSITFVAIVPLMLWLFTELPLRRVLGIGGLFLGVAVVYLAIRTAVIGTGFDVVYEDDMTNPYRQATTLEKYATIVWIFLKYLLTLFWPHPMSWDYSFREIAYRNLGSFEVWLSLLINGGLLLWAAKEALARATSFRGWTAFGVLAYFACVVLVTNLLVSLGGAPFGIRFLYQPSFGFCIAAGAGLIWLAQKWDAPFATRRSAVLGAAALILVAGGWKTIARNAEWADSYTLALADVKKAPESAKTNMAAGDASMGRGIRNSNEGDVPESIRYFRDAIGFYQKTLEIAPDWKAAHTNIGKSYYEQAKNAELTLQRAQSPAAFWAQMGVSPQGEPKHYVQDLLELSVKYDTSRHNAWENLGHLRKQGFDLPGALRAYQRSLRYAPDTTRYWYNVATAAFQMFQNYSNQAQGVYNADSADKYLAMAEQHLAEVAQRQPQNADRQFDYALALYQQGKYTESSRYAARALALAPRHEMATALRSQMVVSGQWNPPPAAERPSPQNPTPPEPGETENPASEERLELN